jgi:hypothetical protein
VYTGVAAAVAAVTCVITDVSPPPFLLLFPFAPPVSGSSFLVHSVGPPRFDGDPGVPDSLFSCPKLSWLYPVTSSARGSGGGFGGVE